MIIRESFKLKPRSHREPIEVAHTQSAPPCPIHDLKINGSLESMQQHSELVCQRKSDDCGCPEEEWIIGLLHVTIHIEEDGGGHIFIDCGDWDDEKLVDCQSIEELRALAAQWVYSIGIDNNL